MQTNILDWLEATSARCPDAPAVGDEQTDCTWAQLTDTARRAGRFLASRTLPQLPRWGTAGKSSSLTICWPHPRTLPC